MTQECSTGKKTGYAIVALILFIILIPRVLLNVDVSKLDDGIFAFGTISKEPPSFAAFLAHFVVFAVLLWFITLAFEKLGDECQLQKEVDSAGKEGDLAWHNYGYMLVYAILGYALIFAFLHMSMKKEEIVVPRDTLANLN